MGNNRYIKTTIIARALLIAIVGFYISLFILRQWLISPLWMVAVFCILPYAIIYFHRHWKYGIWVVGIASIGLGFYLGWDFYLALGFIMALIALYQTAYTIHEDVHNKIKVSAFDIFTGESVEKFVTYMSLVYVFTFMSFYTSFDLTCDELYAYSNKALDVALLRSNPELVEKAKGYIGGFFTTNVDALLTIPQINQVIQDNNAAIITNGNTTNTNIPTGQYPENDPGAKYRVTTKTTTTTKTTQSDSINDAVQVHNTATSTGKVSITVLNALDEYRKRVLEQTVDSSDEIEQGVCSIVVKEIKKKYNNPDFKISVIFMMYLIIRPAMELGLHLISYVNWAIFQSMFSLGWFRKYEDREVGENLE